MSAVPLLLLSRPLYVELEKLGFKKFTEIQERAIPLILSSQNVLLIAPTGTGKTEAAIIPIFELFIQKRSTGEKLSGISILYVTPLRSLNRDIFRRLVEIGANLAIKVDVRHGDTPKPVRAAQALSPPNMLITTPETLQALLVGRKMREHLRNVRWVVIDEIHELSSDKRGAQLTLALERVLALSGHEFQRVGLSATIGNSNLIGRFLVGEGRNVAVVKADEFREMEARVESPSATMEDEEYAEKEIMPSGVVARIRRMLDYMERHRTVLIFTNTREHAESLTSKVRLMAPSVPVGIHHGSLSREIRIETEQSLKLGKLKCVICTSSLELGIDIGLVDFVVQYISPRQCTRIVQRIGRSGHVVAGRPKGSIIAAWPDDILESAVILRRAFNGILEEPEVHYKALDVLAHQLVGLVIDKRSIKIAKALEIISRAHPYHKLSMEELIDTVKQLEAEGKIRVFDELLVVHPRRSFQYYFENLSMIPETKRFTVFDFLTRRKIGVLDQEFVARNGKPDKQFILHGNVWRILSVDEEKHVVEVEGIEPTPAAIPAWEGENIPVPFDVANEVGDIRQQIAKRLSSGEDPIPILSEYPMDKEAQTKLLNSMKKQLDDGFLVPSDKLITIEGYENYTLIHACFGDKVNQTLSRLLASLITAKTGVEIAVQSDPYRIALIAPYALESDFVAQELIDLQANDAVKILDNTLDQTALFSWRLWHNARRFGIVSPQADYKLIYVRSLLKILFATPIYRETFREIYLENLDIDNARRILDRVQSGEIKVRAEPRKESLSPLSLPLMDKIAPHDLIQPASEQTEVLTILKGRLSTKTIRLVCAFKGDWEGTKTVRTIEERPRCPKCGSSLLAATYRNDKVLQDIVRKKIKKMKLTLDESKIWQTAWKSASLVQNYGRKALVALAARGVGPTGAVRLLRRQYRNEDGFYLAILRAERDYLRTKMFWD